MAVFTHNNLALCHHLFLCHGVGVELESRSLMEILSVAIDRLLGPQQPAWIPKRHQKPGEADVCAAAIRRRSLVFGVHNKSARVAEADALKCSKSATGLPFGRFDFYQKPQWPLAWDL